MTRLLRYTLLVLLIAAGLIALLIYSLTWRPLPKETLTVSCSAQATPLVPGQALKVMTWNLQYLAGKRYVFWNDQARGEDERPTLEDMAFSLDEVARVIRDEQPDVVLLQEAFRTAGWIVRRKQCDINHILPVKGRGFAEYWDSRPGQLRTTLKRKAGKVTVEIHDRFDPAAWAEYEAIYRESWKPEEGDPALLRRFAEAEALAIARDIALAELAAARIHIRQVTTARGFDLVREAKARGLPVTCGITPAHFMLSDLATADFRTFTRISPPLRVEADRQAALAAIGDGTVDVIASGHDPRGPEDKRLPFADAEPGMAGAETLLPLTLGLVRDGVIDSVDQGDGQDSLEISGGSVTGTVQQGSGIDTFLMTGGTVPQMAEKLRVKNSSIETYLKRATAKLGVSGRHGLAKWMAGA